MVGTGYVETMMKKYGENKVHLISQVARQLFTILGGWFIAVQVSQRLGGDGALLGERMFWWGLSYTVGNSLFSFVQGYVQGLWKAMHKADAAKIEQRVMFMSDLKEQGLTATEKDGKWSVEEIGDVELHRIKEKVQGYLSRYCAEEEAKNERTVE